MDEEDSSLTRSVGLSHAKKMRPRLTELLTSRHRSNKMWEEIFQQAGLKIVKEEVQLGLPQGLFMVKSWALR